MGDRAVVMWDESLLGYEFGDSHPMSPVRLELTMALARATGALDGARITEPRPATDAELALVHDSDYLEAVRRAPDVDDPTHGLGTADNPVFADMHAASALVAGASVQAAEAVWTGAAPHAVSLAGGLHHAKRARAAGFCVYNDAAVAIGWLLAQGAERVAYVDVDAHHGDGVEEAFAADPRVLTISLHQSPLSLFPGTGFPEDVGLGVAAGNAVNVALPVGTKDAGWLRAFDGVVPVLLREFGPQVLVTQCGCDAHRRDDLADLELTVDGQHLTYRLLHDLAHELCDGRWVALGGGGYDTVDAVPRAWTGLLAVATGASLPDRIPEEWRAFVRTRTGRDAPRFFSDGDPASYEPWEAGEGDPDSPLDRAVAATRRAVLPLHGLDPLRDR